MKNKKIFLLLALALFLLPLIKVDAKQGNVCGRAYLPGFGYTTAYRQSAAGTTATQCGPSASAMLSHRISNSSEYTFDGSEYKGGDIIYYYTKHGLCGKYATVEYDKKGTTEAKYNCIKLYYSSPKSLNNFKEAAKARCVARFRGSDPAKNYWVASDFKYYNGDYWLIDSLTTKETCEGIKDSTAADEALKAAAEEAGVNVEYSNGSSCSADYIYYGCTGSNVKELQHNLNETKKCSSSIGEDGDFGPATENCVKEFQTASGLTADGIVGTRTLTALNETLKNVKEDNSKNQTDTTTTISYYNVTFNTNGGHFINGESSRTIVVSNNDAVLAPSTIPGKENYKFLGWYNGENKYTFGEKTTNNLTLTAHWEKIDSNLYCENEIDVLDYETGYCITAQSFDSSTYSGKVFDLNNTGVLQTIQTKNAFDRTCNNGIYNIEFNAGATTGSNNTVSCSEGYVRDLWKSEDTCNNMTSCSSTATDSCYRTWNGTCYKTYKAAKYDNNDAGDGKDKETTSTDKTDDEITTNSKTGNVLFIVALVIGLGALGYSIYYFVKRKKEA